MIANLIGLLRRRRVDWKRGSIAIEFAIALPVLATLILGVYDYGALMYTSASLRAATRAEENTLRPIGTTRQFPMSQPPPYSKCVRLWG